MIDSHVQFEMLCGLATGGELTETELSDLRSHRDVCAICRERLDEMGKLAEGVFMACALAESSGKIPDGMSERFVARANREGVPLRRRTALSGIHSVPLLAGLGLLALAVCVSSTWRSLLLSGSGRVVRSQTASVNYASGSDWGPSRQRTTHVEAEGAHVRRVSSRSFAARVRHMNQTAPSAKEASLRGDSDDHEELNAPHVDFVMYSIQPRFSNNYAPSFSPGAEIRYLKPSTQGEISVFDRLVVLKEKKPLLEAFSNSQSPEQNTYLPNGTPNFRFSPSDFPLPQSTAH